ncbi:hypothetical protein IEQ34_000891 [Dendrobium chrysotoxum]|uniref:Uncharacterized protein n=1 Tax=Dendrobium chrysotoxum TaxID=161865 RepID=A0AAV7HMP1_DENCH|nr:hypothetical protein IEQ34_000891 [Dendrobium chrysotoxum]
MEEALVMEEAVHMYMEAAPMDMVAVVVVVIDPWAIAIMEVDKVAVVDSMAEEAMAMAMVVVPASYLAMLVDMVVLSTVVMAAAAVGDEGAVIIPMEDKI